MKINHEAKTVHEALGITEERMKKIQDDWKDVIKYLDSHPKGFKRTEFIELILSKITDKTKIETAVFFDVSLQFYEWLMFQRIPIVKIPVDQMPQPPKPPEDPREVT